MGLALEVQSLKRFCCTWLYLDINLVCIQLCFVAIGCVCLDLELEEEFLEIDGSPKNYFSSIIVYMLPYHMCQVDTVNSRYLTW